MKTLGISLYISYIIGLHPWWILHAGRVHWCWTSETLGARHGIIIVFYIMSSIRDFRSCTTFWISMLLLSGVGVVAIQGRPTWFPLPPWRPDWRQRGIDGPGGERKRRKKCEIDYCYNCLQKYLTNQLLALQWVHNHIADFGGDPDRVTIQVNKIGYCCIVTSALLFSSITWWDGNII